MELNLTNLKDLKYICELAELALMRESDCGWTSQWLMRARHYSRLFEVRIADLEQKLAEAEDEDSNAPF